MTYHIHLKRIYAEAGPEDGARVLVDRLWPRGKRRESLALDDWYRDAAPSSALRRAYHQGSIDRATFACRYRLELDGVADVLLPLMVRARRGPLTLLSAARCLEESHLPLLRDALLAALEREDIAADGVELSSPACYAAQVDTWR